MLRQVLTLLLLAAGLPASDAAAGPPAERAARMAASLCGALEPGDLVFKGASTALWTEMAAAWSSEQDRRWGHVGIVLSVEPGTDCSASIVHADTGTGNPEQAAAPGEEIGAVRAVPFADFLGDVDHAGIFRLSLSDNQRARMTGWAAMQADRLTPFDRGYNLDSANNLYCTELVWRAMSEGLGEDAIPEKSHRMGRTYVALSDLSLHPLAEEVAELDWRTANEAPPAQIR